MPWTPEDDRKIIQLRQEGKTLAEISLHMHDERSAQAVADRFRRKLQHTLKDWKPSRKFFGEGDDAKMASLRAQGSTWKEIARHFPGRTVKQLEQRYRRRLNPRYAVKNLSKYNKPYTSLEIAKVHGLRDVKFLSWPQIAAALLGRHPLNLQQ